MRTRAARTPAANVTSAFDFNRDGRVNVLDELLARGNLGSSLRPAAAQSFPSFAAPPTPARNRRPPPRLDVLSLG
jgi:hypothetical protein